MDLVGGTGTLVDLALDVAFKRFGGGDSLELFGGQNPRVSGLVVLAAKPLIRFFHIVGRRVKAKVLSVGALLVHNCFTSEGGTAEFNAAQGTACKPVAKLILYGS